MKVQDFQKLHPDLYKVWTEWNKAHGCMLSWELIDLMIAIKNVVIEDMNGCFKETLTPTFLISKLAEFGYKGTLIKEEPLYNSNVSDKPVGSFQEILKID